MRAIALAAALLVTATAWGQESTATFEAASIVPGTMPPAGASINSIEGGPGTRDPGLIRCRHCDLRSLVERAYGVARYQITGASLEGAESFDIVARVPRGARKSDVNAMLRNLLIDRFKLAAHHETRTAFQFALAADAGGAKLRAAQNQGAAAQSKILRSPGAVTIEMAGESMAGLAQWLSRLLDKRVVDATGIEGKFDIELSYDDRDAGASMGAALAKLGLKLENRPAPMDILVVDHVEKTPTEN